MYPSHVLIQFGGTLGDQPGNNEIWTCGIRAYSERSIGGITNSYDLTKAETDDAVEDTANQIVEWFVDPDTHIANNAWIEWVKVNAIGPDGKYLHDQTSEYTFEAQAGGSAPSVFYPLQVANVMTWETGVKRGFAKYGRIYLPSPAVPVSRDGKAASQNLVVASTAAMIKKLRWTSSGSAEIVGFTPSVISKSPSGTGTHRKITAVSADTVLDTQRRRSRQLTRTRTSAPTDL